MSFGFELTATVVASLVLFVVGSLLYIHYGKRYKLSFATLVNIFWALVVGVLVIECIFAYGTEDHTIIQSLLGGLAGASLGSILGIWVSPTTRTETTKFARYWTAIGVGSGFTLKYLIDHAPAQYPWIKAHWLPTAVFLVGCLMTLASVYVSRAYNNSLDIAVRLRPGDHNIQGTTLLTITPGTTANFYAALIGPSDPLCCWQLSTPDLGTIDEDTGRFTATKHHLTPAPAKSPPTTAKTPPSPTSSKSKSNNPAPSLGCHSRKESA